MFKAIDLNLNAGPIKNAWLRLIRQIQTDVEHKRVTNASGSDMGRGDIVRMTAGNLQADLAEITVDPVTARWAAVMAEPTLDGELGVARTDGYAYVRMETELGPLTEGGFVYLSDSDPGAGTTSIPVGGLMIVGVLADGTEYSDENPYAYVVLGHCCTPSENVG